MTRFVVEGLLYVVFGAVVFFLDYAYGTKVYRAIWKQTHKDPLPDGATRGYLAGRTVRERIPVALVLSAILSFIGWRLEVDLIGLLVRGVLFIPVALSAGFFIGALLKRSGRAERVAKTLLDTVEGMEDGSIDPARAVKDAVKTGAGKLREAASGVVSDLKGGTGETGPSEDSPPPAPKAETPAEKPAEQKPSFDEALTRFRRGE